MMMPDHGADVIRIESPAGEPTRSIGLREGDDTVWSLTHLGIPIKYAREPGQVVSGAPGLGQHTAQVLTETGFTTAQINAMADAGAVVLPDGRGKA